jgi:hypothetical protein
MVAQVEKDRPFSEDEIDVKPCIVERIVDQHGIEMGRHRFRGGQRTASKKAACASSIG